MRAKRPNVQAWGASSPVRSPPIHSHYPTRPSKVRDEARKKIGEEAKPQGKKQIDKKYINQTRNKKS